MSGKATSTIIVVFEEDLRAVARLMKATMDAPEDERNRAAGALWPVLYRALYHLLDLPADDDSTIVMGRYPAALRPADTLPKSKKKLHVQTGGGITG